MSTNPLKGFEEWFHEMRPTNDEGWCAKQTYNFCKAVWLDLKKEHAEELTEVRAISNDRRDKLRNIKMVIRKQDFRLKDLRGYLAESVTKECKCPQNTEVNMTAIEDNLRLKADLQNERRIAQKRITTLQSQLEVLTKCEFKDCIGKYQAELCQGCKNRQAIEKLSEVKGE